MKVRLQTLVSASGLLPDAEVRVYDALPELFGDAQFDTEDGMVEGVELEDWVNCWGCTDLETVWLWIPPECPRVDAVRLAAHEFGHLATLTGIPVDQDPEMHADLFGAAAEAAFNLCMNHLWRSSER